MRTERPFCTLKKKLFIALIVAFAILSGLWYAFFYKGDIGRSETSSETPVTKVPSPIPTVTPKLYIEVHMCGSVNLPGVVRVEEGSRVITALEEAGGFSEEADREYLNLARFLKDGERIYVPSLEETSVLSHKDRIAGIGIDDGSGENDDQKETKVNINKAEVKELTLLPGIGESRAKDIIAYRNKVGAFEKKEDIKNVSGIGDSLYSRIEEFICIE